MKKKIISLLLFGSLICSAIPSTAFAECVDEEKIEHEVEEIISAVTDARDDDGTISFVERKSIENDFSEDAIEAYSEIMYEEAAEAIEEMDPIELDSTTDEYYDKSIIDLDCGAQLQIVTEVTDVTEEEELKLVAKSTLHNVKDFFIPSVYAWTRGVVGCEQSFCTKKYDNYATAIGVGKATIQSIVWLKASKNGLEITKQSCEGRVSGMFVEKSTKKKIEDSKAEKVGYDCHARAGVSYYAEYGSWRTASKWEKIRQKFKVTAIHKNKVCFDFKLSGYTTDYWDE